LRALFFADDFEAKAFGKPGIAQGFRDDFRADACGIAERNGDGGAGAGHGQT
jgi:hypothetical protein